MLFVREDGVDLTWSILTPVIRELEQRGEDRSLFFYGSGSEGPVEAEELLERDGRHWRPL